MILCVLSFISVWSMYGQNLDKSRDKAFLSFQLKEYEACISYCEQMQKSSFEDKEISQIWQASIDTLAIRKIAMVKQLTNVFDFSKALTILKSINKCYSEYQDITKKINQYEFFVQEQKKGNMVSVKLVDMLKKYDRIDSFHDGWARVGKKTKDGYAYNHISHWGQEIDRFNSYCVYTHEFSDGYSVYGYESVSSITDSNGKSFLPWEMGFKKPWGYDAFTDFEEGFMRIRKKNGKWGYFGKDRSKITCKYDKAWPFHDNLALVLKGNHYYFIDRTGKKYSKNINFFGFGNLTYYSEGLLWVGKYIDKKTYHVAIDKLGNTKIKIPMFFENNGKRGLINLISPFKDGLSLVELEIWNEEKHKDETFYGFIDKNGNVSIDFIYEKARNFREGLCAVMKNGKWGYINDKGEIVIPFIYSYADDFVDGYAVVYNDNGKCGFINNNNVFVIPPKYDLAENFSEGFAVIKKNGIYGLVDRYGFCTLDYKNQ